MKQNRKKELLIGVSVIVALVILFFGIDYLKGINIFTPSNFYYVEYENVAGLEVAAPVTMQGYKIGQVREIDFPFDKPGDVRVLLALDKDLVLSSDAYAVIEPGLLGGASISIHQGTSKEKLAVGGTLNSSSGGDLMSAISNDVMPKINSILPKVDSLLASLNVLVSDPALAATVKRMDGISGNLLATTQGLNNTANKDVPMIMRNANGVLTNVNGVVTNVGGVVNSAGNLIDGADYSMRSILSNVGNATVNIDSITRDLAVLSYQLKALPLQPTMENVQTVTANLERFTSQLNNPNSTLGMLMNDPELYHRLNTISADVDSLIVDIKKNPKRYISIKLL